MELAKENQRRTESRDPMRETRRWYFVGRSRDPNGFEYYGWVQKIIQVVGTRHNLIGENLLPSCRDLLALALWF